MLTKGLGLAVAIAVVLAPAGPVGADWGGGDSATGASGTLTETGGSTSAWGIAGSGRTAHRGGGASDVVCRYYRVSAEIGVGVPADDAAPGETVVRRCEDRSTGRPVSLPTLVVVPEPSEAAVVAALVDQAMAQLDVELPDPRTSPPGGRTLANLDTWFWLADTAPQRRSATAAGVTATVTSRLVDVAFDLGDEGVLRCRSGGTAYDPARPARTQRSDCTHAFAAPTRRVDVEVTATWRISWTATTGAGGDLGTVSRTAVLPVDVEARTTVIRDA